MKIQSIPFGEDLIEEMQRFILRDGFPLDETTVVFGGKRPSLYLKRRLAAERQGAFYSPVFYSMAEFIDSIARAKHHDFTDLSDNDAIWVLYNTIQSLPVFDDHPFRRKGFGEFFHWGRYILNFIDQLDAENVPDDRLRSLEENAEIGYDVPESVNGLLLRLSILRQRFRQTLKERKYFTKGYKYLCALAAVKSASETFSAADAFLGESRRVYFAGLFALTGVEKEIIKNFLLEGKGELIVEGNTQEWPILRAMIADLGAECEMIDCRASKPDRISIHSGFDVHSEVVKVYEILKNRVPGKTAIVLPTSEPLFPLLTFAVDRVDEKYNISLGYPFPRTSVFDLVAVILEIQINRRRGRLYPAKNYLEIILHPFIKNLSIGDDLRALLLNIERSLTGEAFVSALANKPFVTLEEIERECEMVNGELGTGNAERGANAECEALQSLREVHRIFFKNFETVKNLYEIAERLEEALTFLFDYSPVRSYVLSGEIFKQLFESLEDLKETQFSRERFHENRERNRNALCDFVLFYLKSITLPFETKPVEPLEILGVLETRNIHFDSVIVLDVNEGVLPQPKKIDPLVPVGTYAQLGIPSPEYNEEIFRYHFYRLVASAKDVHLLYIDSPDKQRSRYVEQIIWDEEKSRKALNVLPVDKSAYKINLKPREVLPEIEKTSGVLRLLKTKTYSATAIDDYVRCPVLFYYGHVLNFEEKKVLSEDIDVMDRGNIIHRILFETFEGFRGREIAAHIYDEVLARMNDAIDRNFRDRVVTGDFYLFREIARYKLQMYLRRSVRGSVTPFAIRYLEEPAKAAIHVGASQIDIKGRIDRIDFIPGTGEYTIIDYKTGGSKQYPDRALQGIDVHSIESIHSAITSFQLPLYIFLFHKTFSVPIPSLNAKLVLLRNNEEEFLFRSKTAEEREEVTAGYMEAMKTVLRDILDESKPFKSFDQGLCNSCTFNDLCKT